MQRVAGLRRLCIFLATLLHAKCSVLPPESRQPFLFCSGRKAPLSKEGLFFVSYAKATRFPEIGLPCPASAISLTQQAQFCCHNNPCLPYGLVRKREFRPRLLDERVEGFFRRAVVNVPRVLHPTHADRCRVRRVAT
eukprot:6214200-Pleurochrysis_carterae.AAC.2